VITVKGVNNFLMGVAFYGAQVNLSSRSTCLRVISSDTY